MAMVTFLPDVLLESDDLRQKVTYQARDPL